ncbi:hypothetical protein [Pendulispora albinea]|uniref:Uncharacterized protein n=1 Tax=Pendulispora albinea TaxID=2741071 RepID=A0ABZ2LM87_9BACT
MVNGVRLVAWLIGSLALLACSNHDAPSCYRGEFLTCACNGARSGLAMCLADESGYGTCDCSGAVPGLDASVPPPGEGDAGAGDASGGKLPFMSGCDQNEQCETGLCFPFNAKGPHCSKRCAGDGDCPSPSPGCNNQKVCKAP